MSGPEKPRYPDEERLLAAWGGLPHARDFNPRSPNGKRPVKMDSLSHNAGTIVHSRHRSYRKPLLTLQIPSRRLQTPHNIHYEVIKQPEEQRRPSSSCHFAVRKDEYSIEALRRHQSHDIISDVHLLAMPIRASSPHRQARVAVCRDARSSKHTSNPNCNSANCRTSHP